MKADQKKTTWESQHKTLTLTTELQVLTNQLSYKGRPKEKHPENHTIRPSTLTLNTELKVLTKLASCLHQMGVELTTKGCCMFSQAERASVTRSNLNRPVSWLSSSALSDKFYLETVRTKWWLVNDFSCLQYRQSRKDCRMKKIQKILIYPNL
jgi:hypothetical protein